MRRHSSTDSDSAKYSAKRLGWIADSGRVVEKSVHAQEEPDADG